MASIQETKNPRAPLRLARWMREAGFVVEQDPWPVSLPTCGWPSGRLDDPWWYPVVNARKADAKKIKGNENSGLRTGNRSEACCPQLRCIR